MNQSWNRVDTARVKRVAFQNPLQGKPAAFKNAMPVDGFQCILRATRKKPAVGPEDRGHNELVDSYNG